MSVTKPWKQWEGGFYRRTLQSTLHKDASSLFTYHHHVLMGCTLWMVRKEIEPNEEPEYKFSKVQGTRKGRLRGLVLNTDSEVRGSIHNEQLEGIFNRRTKHMIDVTGKCHFEQSESTWQLVTLSKAVYEEWMERLHSATGFLARLEESGEAKQLYHIAQKVKASVRSRTHWYKFVAYANSFCGYRAVSAIAKHCHCNLVAALIVGNKLIVIGLMGEVRGEQLLGNDYRLYTFHLDHILPSEKEDRVKLARIDSAEEVKEVIDQEGGEGNKEMADEVVSSASESLSPMLPPPPPPLATLPSLWSVLTMTGVGVWVLGVVLWVCTPRGKGVWGEWTGEVFIALSFLVLLYMMQVNNTMVEIQQKRVREDGRGIARRASEGREVVTTEQLPAPDHVLRTPTPWSHYPLLITRSPLCLPTDITPSERAALLHPITLPDNAVVSIRNEFFEGKVKILFRHTKPEHFRGKKRYFEYVVQGRFTREVAFQSVFTGQSCPAPLPYQPSRWLISALHAFQPSVLICAEGDRPYFLSPLMSTMQRVAITLPGSEPDIKQAELEDDLRVLDNELLNTLTPYQRRRYFKHSGNLEKYSFKPEFVYTFSAYEHLFSFENYQAELGIFTYDITKVLGKMPMQIMGLIWDPPPPPHTSTPVYNDISDNTYSASQWQYIYCFDVYHIKQREQLLLEEEERAVSRQSEADSESEGRSMHVPP